jgi:putative ABC transport system permease protein
MGSINRLKEWSRRLGMLLGRRRFERNLEEEARLHVALREAERLQSGLSPEDAHSSAVRQFGNEASRRDESREKWGWAWLDRSLQDVKYGWRVLLRNPGFTAVAIITLALGIGANTAIFSAVNAVLLKPLPYPDADRLVMIWVTEPSAPDGLFPATGPDFQDWVAQNHVFEGMAGSTSQGATLTGNGEPVQLRGAEVTPSIFSVLQARPLLGRTFSLEEGTPGHNHVVVLSYGLWQGAFGGKREIVGNKITLDGESYDVVGVMPASFKHPPIWGSRPQYWTPLDFEKPDYRKERGNHWFWVVARLKPGVTLHKAAAEMETLSGQIAKQYPQTNTGVIAKVKSLHEQLTGRVQPILLVLFAAVGFLMLIACANVANLLLTKSIGRQREVAIRMAVGSGTLRVIRQFLTESILLFLVGGAAGLAVGYAGMQVLTHSAPEGYVGDIFGIHLDPRVFGFTFLVAFVTGTLAGLVPAISAARVSFNSMLKEGGRSVSSQHQWARRFLTSGEIAVALILLVGAGLATKSLTRLLGVDLGFDPHNVLTARISLPTARYPKDVQQANFFHSFLERVRGLPGVASAAAASELPLQGGSNGPVMIEGQPAPKDIWSSPLVESCTVTPGYFHTMKMPMLGGRDFALTDTDKAPLVAVINETMAKHFWPGQDAVGKRFSHSGEKPQWITVVGVVGDVREFGLEQPAIPEAYYPESQGAYSGLIVVIRTATEPLAQVSALRNTLHSVDKDLPFVDPQALSSMVSNSSEEKRFVALLLGLFAGVALLLASVGIYGVVSYSVAQRTREIGIRMAFGAGIRNVLKMVIREGLMLGLAGVELGLIGSWGLTRYLESLLYGVRPSDPSTFALVAVAMILAVLLACFIPARRAARVDPMIALRYE